MVNNTFNYLLEDQTCYYGKHVQVPAQGTHWTQFWTKGEITNNLFVSLVLMLKLDMHHVASDLYCV